MELMPCHFDSYRRAIEAQVLSCTPDADGFRVQVTASVLYPGGGGQPADLGRVGEAQILEVVQPLVFRTDAPVIQGPATVVLDWARRFDHMQQHTAQHLITAVAEQRFGWATTAFHLNPERSDIVLDTSRIGPAELSELSELVNAEIRAARPVRASEIAPAELDDVRFRRLPGDHEGLLRVVEIEGIDRNTCGGTHVANTAELQLVHFLGQENRQGETRLHWLAGGRALAALAEADARAAGVTAAIKRGPAEHVEAVQALVEQAKSAAKANKAALTELAGYLGAELARQHGPLLTLHRPDGDLGFLNAVAKAARAVRPDATLLLTAGSEAGVFLVAGPGAARGAAVAAILDGRGGGRADVFQGKADRLDRRAEASRLLEG